MSLSFPQELIITVVDKGLLAASLLIAGGWLNMRLERYKTDISRHSEFLKLRVQAMSATWAAIYGWMTECDRLLTDEMMRIIDPDLRKLRKEFLDRTEALMQTLAAHRFLCGEPFTIQCLQFCNGRYQYYLSYDPSRTPKIGEAPIPPWESVESVERFL